MAMLIGGIILWAVLHLIPAAAVDFRASLIRRLGGGAYKGLFSLAIVLSLVIIVFGWRSTTAAHLYVLPPFVQPLSTLLLLVAFFLFVASNMTTRVKRIIRHPQLTSVIVWSLAHLLVNGDSRSLVLFGGMALWAMLQIMFTNKRDGAWEKIEAPALSKEIIYVTASLIVFIAVIYLHPYLAGVAVR